MILKVKYWISLFLLVFSLGLKSQKLVTYEVPHSMLYGAHNDDFTVKVRVPGGEWKDLYEYKVKVE